MNTLTSLAILKVNIDQGTDYLDYLRPFVFQILTEYNLDPITGGEVARLIRRSFGLEIPSLTIETVLRRLSKHYPIRRVRGVYKKVGTLPDPGISAKQAEAGRHIEAVLMGSRSFLRILRVLLPIMRKPSIQSACFSLSLALHACEPTCVVRLSQILVTHMAPKLSWSVITFNTYNVLIRSDSTVS